MPQAVVAAVSWVFTGAGIAASVARYVVVSTITAGISRALTPKARPRPTAMQGNIAGGTNHQQIVFGEIKTGGQKLTEGVAGAGNAYLHLALLTSLTPSHGSEGIQGVYINGEYIDWSTDIDGSGDVTSGDFAGLANFRRYSGINTAVVDTILDDALTPLSLWNANAVGHGCQYLACRFYRDPDDEEGFQEAFASWPVVEVKTRGLKCYDPRLDSTNGGTGSHRLATPSTWAWTQNPALILACYLLLEKVHGGVGESSDNIVWANVAAAASVCDEEVDTGIARYRCDIALNTANTHEENIAAIVNTMQGAYVPSYDGIKIYAGEYDTPVATIDADWNIMSYEFVGKGDADNLPTQIKASFTDPGRDYKLVQCQPYTTGHTYGSPEELNLPGVNNETRAQYITQVIGKRSSYPKRLKMAVGMKGRAIEPWDTVTVNFTDGEFSINSVFRVIDAAATEYGAQLTLAEEASAIWTASAFTSVTGYSHSSRATEVPPLPTGLTATGVADGIALTWNTQQGVRFEVHRSTTSGGSFTKIWDGVGNSYTDPLTAGVTRYYKILAVRYGYSKSALTAEVTATSKTVANGADVTGDNTALNTSNVGTVSVASAQADLLTVESLVSVGQVSHVNGSPAGITGTDPRAIGRTSLAFFKQNNFVSQPDAPSTLDNDDDNNFYLAASGGAWSSSVVSSRQSYRYDLNNGSSIPNDQFSVRIDFDFKLDAYDCAPGDIVQCTIDARRGSNSISAGTFGVRYRFFDDTGSVVSDVVKTRNNSELASVATPPTFVMGSATVPETAVAVELRLFISNVSNSSGSVMVWAFSRVHFVVQAKTNDIQDGAVTSPVVSPLLALSRNAAMQKAITLGSTDLGGGTGAQITIDDVEIYPGTTTAFQPNDGTVGPVSYSTTYQVYVSTDDLNNGAKTYLATTDNADLTKAGTYGWLGEVTTVASGGGGGASQPGPNEP